MFKFKGLTRTCWVLPSHEDLGRKAGRRTRRNEGVKKRGGGRVASKHEKRKKGCARAIGFKVLKPKIPTEKKKEEKMSVVMGVDASPF